MCPWPDTKVTVNLAPSQQRKSGSGLDLAIAVGVMAASGRLPIEAIAGLAFVGELGLDGSIRSIPGVAPMAGVLADLDIVVPVANAHEAWVVSDARVRPVAHLCELLAVFDERAPWPDHDVEVVGLDRRPDPDLADVVGQPMARRALEIAAAGGHHCLFVGSPGSGKTMLAARLPGLLPALATRRGARGHDDPFGGRRFAAAGGARHPTAVSGPASHQLRSIDRRRRVAQPAPG